MTTTAGDPKLETCYIRSFTRTRSTRNVEEYMECNILNSWSTIYLLQIDMKKVRIHVSNHAIAT